MIVFHQGKTLREKLNRLRETDLAQTTWLVSDLRSKSELQKELLLRTKCLPEDAVIRVSEFWQKLFHQIQPDFELISSSLTTTYLAEWLAKRKVAWANHPGTPKLLFSYIDFFLPILAREDLVERTREWLRANPSALIRWGSWFELAIEAWQLFLEQKTIARPWASGFLSGLDLEEWPWHRNLILDLGADLTGVEAELVGQIARINGMSVEIYTPDKASRERYSNTLWPYSHLLSEKIAVAKNVTDVFSGDDLAKLVPKRFTSPLAEVKAAADEVYRALESGLNPSEVGIFAAQIEDYWPLLEAYLRTEGIPFAKGVVLSGVSLPSAARWLARMRVESKEISSGDLEHSVFSGAAEAPLSFDTFARLYSKIYEVEDLDRDEKLRATLEFKYSVGDRLDRDQFFDWSLKFWEGDSFGADKIAAAIFQECPTSLRLELRSWIRYVEAILPKIEFTLREGDVNGITVGNFDSAAHLCLKKTVLIGLSESQLADQNEISVSHGDVIKIASDLGINLANLGSRSNAYWVEQVVRQSAGTVELYFAATNAAGEPETPSVLWLEVAAAKLTDPEQCFEPPPSRWDEIQRSQVASEDSELKRLVSIDAGLIAPDKIQQNVPIRYSVSQIENYLKCPFIFTAQKLMKLSDLPDVDLDIDNMTRGRLLHAAPDRVRCRPFVLIGRAMELIKLVDMHAIKWALCLVIKNFGRHSVNAMSILSRDFWASNKPGVRSMVRRGP